MGIRVFDSDGDQSIWQRWGSEYLIAMGIRVFVRSRNSLSCILFTTKSDYHERCQHGIDRVVIWFTSACDITWSYQSDSGSKQDGFLWLLRIPEPIKFYHLPGYCLFKKSWCKIIFILRYIWDCWPYHCIPLSSILSPKIPFYDIDTVEVVHEGFDIWYHC